MKTTSSIFSFMAGAAIVTAANFLMRSSGAKNVRDNIATRIKRAKDKAQMHKVYVGTEKFN